MSIVGLMPAAGHATRLGRAIDGSKEIQPVRGRPILTYLIDRFLAGGATRIQVATRPEKRDVIDLAEALGAVVVTGHPASVSESLLLAAHDLPGDDIALFGFPDTVWTPVDAFSALVELVASGDPLALGIFESPYPARSDVATLDATGRLIRVDVKPAVPTSSLVWAAGAARVAVLREILRESEPGAAFSRLAEAGPLATVRGGRVIDVGTPEAFRTAADDPVFRGEEEWVTSAGTAARPVSRGPRDGPAPRPGR